MSDPLMARTEFAAALNQIAQERGITPESILDSIKNALEAAFRKDYPEDFAKIEEKGEIIDVVLDPDSGEFRLLTGPEDSKPKDKTDVTPPGFGRIAAMTAKQVVMQQVREAEKSAILGEYRDRIGELLTALVLRLDGKNIILDIGRGQGVMPPEEQVHGEFYRPTSRIAVIIADIRDTFKGETVIVSRSDPRLVKELFAREVPEVGTNVVIIKAIAREAGVRTKIAVQSTQDGVDPVGSCVGQKGVRVQAVINELNGERVDIIQYSEDMKKYLAASLAPAENLDMELDDKNMLATVTVPEDQLSLAIGRGGQNVKLAARLTGYKIRIQAGTKVTQTITGTEEHEIDLLNLDQKVRNKLVDAGITLLDQLLGDNVKRLKEIKGIGPKSIKEIEDKLQAYQASRPTPPIVETPVVVEIPTVAAETKEELAEPEVASQPETVAEKPEETSTEPNTPGVS